MVKHSAVPQESSSATIDAKQDSTAAPKISGKTTGKRPAISPLLQLLSKMKKQKFTAVPPSPAADTTTAITVAPPPSSSATAVATPEKVTSAVIDINQPIVDPASASVPEHESQVSEASESPRESESPRRDFGPGQQQVSGEKEPEQPRRHLVDEEESGDKSDEELDQVSEQEPEQRDDEKSGKESAEEESGEASAEEEEGNAEETEVLDQELIESEKAQDEEQDTAQDLVVLPEATNDPPARTPRRRKLKGKVVRTPTPPPPSSPLDFTSSVGQTRLAIAKERQIAPCKYIDYETLEDFNLLDRVRLLLE